MALRLSLILLAQVDEDGWAIAQMGDQEVLAEFDRMLENMNLSEEKKEPLLHLPLSKKREMLSMHSRNRARTQFHSPADYIQYLSNSVRGAKAHLFAKLRAVSIFNKFAKPSVVCTQY